MHQVRLLVLKARPTLKNVARKRSLITYYMLGRHDRQLAASLAVVEINTATEAVRLAAEGKVVCRNH